MDERPVTIYFPDGLVGCCQLTRDELAEFRSAYYVLNPFESAGVLLLHQTIADYVRYRLRGDRVEIREEF